MHLLQEPNIITRMSFTEKVASCIAPSPQYAQNFNRYSYVFNNPLKYTDPSGYAFENWSKWQMSSYLQDVVYKYLLTKGKIYVKSTIFD